MTLKDNATLSSLFGLEWYSKLTEWRSWYSGDPAILKSHYQLSKNGKMFWQRIAEDSKKYAIHFPLAGDIASTSSNLLFSEIPEITYAKNEKTAIDRVQYFIDENGLHNRLLEAAELCSALGGIVLKIDIDTDISPVPIISILSPLQFIPTFRRGRLYEASTFRVVRSDDTGGVWRLFEERQRVGQGIRIGYKLYKGNSSQIGLPVGIKSIEETAGMDINPVIYDNAGLGIVYVPNMLPNRLDIHANQGVSDYSGAIPLLDSLDETWTALIREIRLAKSTIFMDEELDKEGTFDVDTEAYRKIKISDLRLQNQAYKPIEHVQPELRVEEYLRATAELTSEVIARSGYSPQTFGFGIDGRAETGTALRIRERKSMLTRQKKSRYWQNALQWLFWDLQRLENASGITPTYTPVETVITLQDSIVPEPMEEAETIRALRQAEVISLDLSVRRINPSWTDKQVQEEVDRIVKEKGSMVSDILSERI
jgi:hypothetical protein